MTAQPRPAPALRLVSQRQAAIYGRVSDPRQELNWSLPEQERLCREYAAAQGLALDPAHIWLEQGDSEDLSRVGFQALLRAARRGDFTHLIIAKQDRLARNTVMHVALWFAREAGLTPHCVTEPFTAGEIDVAVRALASGIERQSIRFRTQSGRRARARAGKLIPATRALYGYCYKDATKSAYEPDPATAPIVRRLFRECIAGRTLRAIARGLDADGVPTPNGAAYWKVTSIRRILTLPRYWGEAFAYGDERIPLPPGVIPALVTPEEAAAAVDRLQRNRRESPRNSRDPQAYLLRGGFVRCGHCGNVVRTHWIHDRRWPNATARPRYDIQRTRQHHTDCPNTAIAAPALDRDIWAAVVAFIGDDAVLEAKLAEYAERDPAGDELARLEAQLATITARHKRLAARLELVDEASLDEAVGRLNALGQERRALEERRDHLVAQHAGWQERQAHLREVRAMIAAIRETLRDPHGLSYDERRDVLAMLDAQVLLFPTDAAERWELYLSLDPEAPPALVATASSWTVYTTTRCSPSARASTW